jgi:flagellar protein FliS
MSDQLKNYHAADTIGRSQPELVVKVYDGAIGSLRQAMEHYKNDDLQRGFENMEKSKKFIVHLYTTLDEKKGGEIAEKLSKLYVYLIEQINIIQATKDLSIIEDAIEILSNVRDGWMQLVENVNRDKSQNKDSNIEKTAESLSFSV